MEISSLFPTISPVRVNKLGTALASCMVAMTLLLSAIPAQAQTVVIEGNTATAIRDLELNGVTYDVNFVHSTAPTLYGDPPIFDFSTAPDAQAAVQAVNSALNADGGAIHVGPDETFEVDLYLIGFDTLTHQVGGINLGKPVTFTQARFGASDRAEGHWISPPEFNQWPFVTDAIWAQFIVVSTTADDDLDGVSNDVDNCPNDANPSQEDTDNDGLGDACDELTDSDGDGIADSADNCPFDNNPNQPDSDDDGVGDACDALNDSDNDGIADDVDNCPLDGNPGQADADNDGLGDACDDANDSDGDGIADDVDNCPNDANPNQPDSDGDGIGNRCDPLNDFDNDGIDVSEDNCPLTANPGQEDSDNDGRGDACDDANDSDGDGIADDVDNCPNDRNPNQPDSDGDGIGNRCDPLNDSDNDGIDASEDNCPLTANPSQEDTDNDGLGDACDDLTDSDGDGVADSFDNCPVDANPDQEDSDNDGIGDACDALNDTDNDGVADSVDNCLNDRNPDQADADNDGIGNACDDANPVTTFAIANLGGGGDAEAVLFAQDGLRQAEVFDLGTASVLNTISFTAGLVPIDAGYGTDQNGDGADEIYGLFRDDAASVPKVEARDPVTGAKRKNITYTDDQEPIALGITGTQHEEGAVLVRDTTNDNRGRLLIRNLISRETRININLPKKYRVEGLVMAPDFSGNGFDEALVRTTRFSDGKGFILVYDTGVADDQISAISITGGQTVIDHDYTIGPGGVSAVTVLALRSSDLKPRLYVYDALTGDELWAVSRAIGWDPLAVRAFTTSGGEPRIAALFQRTSDDTPIVSTFDANTGELIDNVLFEPGQTGITLTIFPDTTLDSGTEPELGVTMDDGTIKIRDSSSGNLLQSLGGI